MALPFLAVIRDQALRKYDLPHLARLHAFEAVARHTSFTVAADELCLTQSAVSRQIKALEEELNQRLFHRRHRAIELTEAGTRLFRAVTGGFDEIAACVDTLRSEQQDVQITVAASVAFAYYWLMPRIERFSEQCPDIDLRVLATDQVVDPIRDDCDLAVLYGDGHWADLETQPLFGERVYPVCSPGYLERHPELRRASDVLVQTLVHLEGGGNIWGAVDWQVWLARQGVTGQPVRRGVRMNSYPMVLQAAEAGRGVALGWSYITDEMLEDGRLVSPVGDAIETRSGYYIGASESAAARPEVADFIGWMLEEASG